MNKISMKHKVCSAALVGLMLLPSATAFAEQANKSWQYPGARKNICATDTNNSSSSNDQTPPSTEAGDWTQPGTQEYEVAKKIYETLTKEYGWSGAAACGVIGNIAGESSFHPDLAELGGLKSGGKTIHIKYDGDDAVEPAGRVGGGLSFGMNNKKPVKGMAYYVDRSPNMLGGGGLCQFTPFTKFTDSEFWSSPNSTNGGGWYPENQMAFIWDSEFKHADVWGYYLSGVQRSSYTSLGFGQEFNSVEDFFKTDNVGAATRFFMMGYERPYQPDPRRWEWAQTAYELFNGANDKPDPSKWMAKGFDPNGSHGATIDGTSSSSSETQANAACKKEKEGGVDTGVYLATAQSIAGRQSVGYSQGSRDLNPNVDCSSFVWHSLVDSGALTKDALGGSPFNTHSMGSILTSNGFTEMAYDENAVQPGDILWRDDHAEIYLGKFNLESLDSAGNPSPDENGTPLTIGAMGVFSHPEDGDQGQDTEGKWYGGEVGAYNLSGRNFTKIYRPDKSLLEDGGFGEEFANASETGKKIVLASNSVPSPGSGLCAAWVTNVYSRAGLNPPYGNANDMYYRYCKSSNKSELKVGMLVAEPSNPGSSASEIYGHVGIYIGDGMVKHNLSGNVGTMPLDQWIKIFGAWHEVRWGYPPGV